MNSELQIEIKLNYVDSPTIEAALKEEEEKEPEIPEADMTDE